MKSFIIIVSLLVSTEIQFSLCGDAKYDTTINEFYNDQTHENPSELKPLSHNSGQKNTGHEVQSFFPNDESQMTLNSRAIESSATIAGGEKTQQELMNNIEDMRTRAHNEYLQALANAKLAFKEIQVKFDTLREKAATERDVELKKCDDQYQEATFTASVISKIASKKLERAKEGFIIKSNQALITCNDKSKKSMVARYAAAVDAVEKLEKIRERNKEKKQKVEKQHQEALKKAHQERETALEAAEKIREKANENYNKAMKPQMSSEERRKIIDERQEEIDKYDVALEKAEDEWQKVLDTFGIGEKYEAALISVVKKLEQAQKTVDLLSKPLMDGKQRDFKKVELNKLEMEKLDAERSEVKDESDKFRARADNRVNICAKRAWRRYRQITKPAFIEMDKAVLKYSEAKKEAENEYKKALEKADEMERKLKEAIKLKMNKLGNVQKNKPRARGKSSNSK